MIQWHNKECLRHADRRKAWAREAQDDMEGTPGPGRSKMTWKALSERDRCEWKPIEVDPSDRDVMFDFLRKRRCLYSTSSFTHLLRFKQQWFSVLNTCRI